MKRCGTSVARTRIVLAMCLCFAYLSVPPALAHDGSDTSPTAVTASEDRFAPFGQNDDPYNGYRVYLSSPRHRDSGSKGECRNPGHEENVNGREWNWLAANGNYIGDIHTTTSHGRNLHARGYGVIVSPNSRDNGYMQNLYASRNWGSDIHIVTHTNGTGGCPSNTSYLLTMWNSSADHALAGELGRVLDPGIPGDLRSWSADFAELSTNARRGDAYVELQFHDNPYANAWLASESIHHAWRYGYAVDQYLGYP
jgi:hypothetical protein